MYPETARTRDEKDAQSSVLVDLTTSSEEGPKKAFSLAHFIPLLRERIYVVSPFTRSYLVSWITVLDSVPELELITYLPEFLDGLLLKDALKRPQVPSPFGFLMPWFAAWQSADTQPMCRYKKIFCPSTRRSRKTEGDRVFLPITYLQGRFSSPSSPSWIGSSSHRLDDQQSTHVVLWLPVISMFTKDHQVSFSWQSF